MREDTPIKLHAIQRFRERFPSLDLIDEMSSAMAFGGQRGDATLFLSRSGVVFVQNVIGGIRIVCTVLSQDQAIANMQSSGLSVRTEPSAAAKDNEINPEKLAEIWAIAREHAQANYPKPTIGKKRRSAQIASLGIDACGKEGDEYRASYQAEIIRLASEVREKRKLEAASCVQ